MKGEADVCFGSLTITASRATAIDYSLGVMAEPYSLGIRDPDIYNPPSGRVDASVFLTVFNLQLWLTCLGTWAGITLVHFCVSFSRNRYDGRSLRPGALGKQLVESSAFLVRFIAQLDDGDNKRYFLDLCARKFHNKTPGIVASCVHCAICILTFHKTCRKSVSYKALLLTSTALAIVLFASFGAHITSFMTLIPYPALPKSLEQLVELDYTLWIHPGTSQDTYIRLVRVQKKCVMLKDSTAS